MKRFATYLLQGLLITAPVAITIYIFYALVTAIDNTINPLVYGLTGIEFPGLGLLFGLLLMALIGFLGSSLLFKPLFGWFEEGINHMPFVKIVYSSIKDLFSAFVSDQRKFNQPVLVKFGNLQRMGFLTEDDMSAFGLKDKVAIYLPHSYNFSGNLYIADVNDVTLLDAKASEVMKFVVSGGVTRFENNDK